MGRGSSKAGNGGASRPSINAVVKAVEKTSPHDYLSWQTIPKSIDIKGQQFDYISTARFFSESRRVGVVTTSYQAEGGNRDVFTVEVELKDGEIEFASPKAFWE